MYRPRIRNPQARDPRRSGRRGRGARFRAPLPTGRGIPLVAALVAVLACSGAVAGVAAVAAASPGSQTPASGALGPFEEGPANVGFVDGGELAPDPGNEETPSQPEPGDGGPGPAVPGGPGSADSFVVGASQTTIPAPVLLVDRWRSRVSRRARIVITGTAEHASGIARVRYSLARRVHGEKGSETDDGCRYLERRRRFTQHPWPCDALRNFRTARGTTTWTATMPRRLQRGRYIFAAQAQAANGDYSPVKRVRFRVVA